MKLRYAQKKKKKRKCARKFGCFFSAATYDVTERFEYRAACGITADGRHEIDVVSEPAQGVRQVPPDAAVRLFHSARQHPSVHLKQRADKRQTRCKTRRGKTVVGRDTIAAVARGVAEIGRNSCAIPSDSGDVEGRRDRRRRPEFVSGKSEPTSSCGRSPFDSGRGIFRYVSV